MTERETRRATLPSTTTDLAQEQLPRSVEDIRLIAFFARGDYAEWVFDPGSEGLLTLAMRRGRSRFWLTWPDDERDPVALPRPERWGFLPDGIDPVRLAKELRARARDDLRRYSGGGGAPRLEEPYERPGPSYNSPGA